ncbi:MAG TPA: carboxypeptidase regulatory-like domain-containing protein [Terriglobia bacterium]|nr:carboxypeptidase regulatory-like domain-containing protein [Terriglobia bacterium]
MSGKTFGVVLAAVGLTVILRAVPGRGSRGQGEAAGSVKGTIYFQGVKPHLSEINMAQDRVCASEQTGPVYPEDGQVNSNGTLPNVFVYVEGRGIQTYKPPSTPVTLAQRRCEYEPHVLGIMVGQPLQVTTEDPTTHNVHVMPKDNRSWNVSQQPGSQPLIERFTHPEIMIPVKCNQHPWMKAYIGVTTNPFYAVTGNDGTFTIPNVPPGQYTLGVWTATFGTQKKQVTVEAGKAVTADFTFESH